MASPFARLAAVAAVTHDKVHGEAFEFRPMKHQADRNAPRVVDDSRPVVTALAVWGDPAARAGAGPFHQVGVQPERAGHSTTRPYISLQLSRLPYRPSVGDLVWRQEAETLYRIFEVLPSTPGFVRISLNGA
ncbi:MAG: hypothetical protein KDE14_01605 [Rhodobacteraceae bacterium]|nr:hypothetical protein [Paracoccaceae bacterium]